MGHKNNMVSYVTQRCYKHNKLLHTFCNYCYHTVMYMLGTKLAPAPCWNWDVFFAPCWNWDKNSPVVAPCQHEAKIAILTRPVLELGAPCWNWTFDPNPRIITGPIVAPEPPWGTPNCH